MYYTIVRFLRCFRIKNKTKTNLAPSRSPRSHSVCVYVCLSVRLFGTKLSKGLNLHLRVVWVSLRSVSGLLRSVSGLSQVSLRSVLGQSQVHPWSVPGHSKVSLRSLLGISEITLSVRRSLKYFVLFTNCSQKHAQITDTVTLCNSLPHSVLPLA